MSAPLFNLVFMDPDPSSPAALAAAYSGLWYSKDYGVSWYQSTQPGEWGSIFIRGLNALACTNVLFQSVSGIIYSIDGGKTWAQSEVYIDNNLVSGLYFNEVFMEGQNAIASSASNAGLFYSTDYGRTWYQSDLSNAYFWGVSMLPNGYALACGAGISGGLESMWFSSDYGKTWLLCEETRGTAFYRVVQNGQYALAGSSGSGGIYFSGGVYYSDNYGMPGTWIKTASILNPGLAMSGTNAVAASIDGFQSAILYSKDNGKTWTTTSNVNTYEDVALVGTNLLATYAAAEGISYSSNLGETLTTQLPNIGFWSVSMSLNKAIAGDFSTNTGLYYSTDYGQTWTNATLNYYVESGQQGAITVTYLVPSTTKTKKESKIVKTFKATSTSSGTGQTYERALANAARSGINNLVKELYEKAQSYSNYPIVNSSVELKTQEPMHKRT